MHLTCGFIDTDERPGTDFNVCKALTEVSASPYTSASSAAASTVFANTRQIWFSPISGQSVACGEPPACRSTKRQTRSVKSFSAAPRC